MWTVLIERVVASPAHDLPRAAMKWSVNVGGELPTVRVAAWGRAIVKSYTTVGCVYMMGAVVLFGNDSKPTSACTVQVVIARIRGGAQ
eukprot:917443-Lingulodinium_polyedra.AAC.1